jgi:biotin carboxyl carrier protein
MSAGRAEFRVGPADVVVSFRSLGNDRFAVRVGEREHTVTARAAGDGFLMLELEGRLLRCAVARTGSLVQVRAGGWTYALRTPEARGAQHAAHGPAGDVVEAPMAGTVLAVLVEPGDVVAARQPLVLLVAMKMEHRLVAPRAGVVAEVPGVAGAIVAAGTVLIRLEPDPIG